MKTYETFLKENKSDYEIYHDSYTSTIVEVERYVKNNRYTLDPEEMADKVGLGPKKPSKGKTNRLTISLYKNKKDLADGKKQKKAVHFQVYNRGTSGNTYELSCVGGNDFEVWQTGGSGQKLKKKPDAKGKAKKL